jgi:DNA-binding transcriptional regulator YdaS (Cro superfamily)
VNQFAIFSAVDVTASTKKMSNLLAVRKTSALSQAVS